MASDARILITGAAGTHGGIGAHLVQRLREEGAPVRAMVRVDDQRAQHLRALGAEVVVGDFLKLSTLRPALQGIDRVFFCYPLAEGLLQATANLCVAAHEASVRAVVNVTIMLAAEDHPSPICRDHWLSERMFDWAQVGAVHLRGGFFYENLLRFAADGVVREDRIVLPFGDGDARLAWVGAVDLASVAAAILTQPGEHLGNTYEITGDAPLSIKEIAALMSAQLNRDIIYAASPLPEWLKRCEAALGDNAQLRRHVTVLSNAFSANRVLGRVNTLVQSITGRPPQGFSGFLAAHAADFRA